MYTQTLKKYTMKIKKFLKSRSTRKEILEYILRNNIKSWCIWESKNYYELDFK